MGVPRHTVSTSGRIGPQRQKSRTHRANSGPDDTSGLPVHGQVRGRYIPPRPDAFRTPRGGASGRSDRKGDRAEPLNGTRRGPSCRGRPGTRRPWRHPPGGPAPVPRRTRDRRGSEPQRTRGADGPGCSARWRSGAVLPRRRDGRGKRGRERRGWGRRGRRGRGDRDGAVGDDAVGEGTLGGPGERRSPLHVPPSALSPSRPPATRSPLARGSARRRALQDRAFRGDHAAEDRRVAAYRDDVPPAHPLLEPVDHDDVVMPASDSHRPSTEP